MPTVIAWVHHEPIAQPRVRATRRGERAGVYEPQGGPRGGVRPWRYAVAAAVRDALLPLQIESVPKDAAVAVALALYLRRPKRLMRKRDPAGPVPHINKPDVDNLVKSTLDGLVSGGVLFCDAQVCSLSARKFVHAKDGHPCASIQLWWEQGDAEGIAVMTRRANQLCLSLD